MVRRHSRPEISSETIQSILRSAVLVLRGVGTDTPMLDAEVMLSKVMGWPRVELLTHPEFHPTLHDIERFSDMMDRRARREPLAYIIGERSFYALDFEVSPGVLIPRQETEILVEAAVEIMKKLPNPIVADIGLGSGAIAISIAKAVSNAVVYGTESNDSALEIARKNAERLGVSEHVHFYKGDFLQPLQGLCFDLIVSNPPYIPSGEIEHLQPEVAEYEPREALDGGLDGLDYYRRFAVEAPEYLRPGGILAVEVGAGQSSSVQEIFRNAGFTNVRSICDYSNIERVVLGEKGQTD